MESFNKIQELEGDVKPIQTRLKAGVFFQGMKYPFGRLSKFIMSPLTQPEMEKRAFPSFTGHFCIQGAV